MANDGQIVFEVTADGKHAISDIKDITRTIQKETKKWDDAAGESADNIDNSFSGVLKKLTAGFSAVKIGKALLQIGKDAIQAASDLQEVQNVVDVTFGSNANQIETWAKNAGKQFGLTETQAKKFTSTMGAMLKSAGLAGDEIVGVSTDLAGLAADMASFYNLDFEEAFSKIRSGISGQTMPLKELGIDMSVATLNAFALQKGLSKTFDQMTQGEQVMLRYQYLMSATADAQGDFSRTSDGFANATRALETNIESLKTKLGEALLPTINDVINAINKLFPEDSGNKHSMLDDIAEINIKKDAKIAEINEIKDIADECIQTLNSLGGNAKAGAQLENMAKGANALDSSSKENWQVLLQSLQGIDGLDNLFGDSTSAEETITKLAGALSGDGVSMTKAKAWETFLGALSNNADAVSKLTGDSASGTKEWLEGLASSAKELGENDAEAWNTLMSALISGVNIGQNDEGKKFVEMLAQNFLALGNNSEEAIKGLQALGYSTEDINNEQAVWLAQCKELVKQIPALSSIIDTNTGEVKGGIPAIREYADEWERTAKYQAEVEAIRSARQVYEENNNPEEDYANALTLKSVATVKARNAGYADAEKNLDAISGIIQKYIDIGYDSWDTLKRDVFDVKTLTGRDVDAISSATMQSMAADYAGVETDDLEWFNKLTGEAEKAVLEYAEAEFARLLLEKERPEVLADMEAAEQRVQDEYGVTDEELEELIRQQEEAAASMTTLERAADGQTDALEQVQTAVSNAGDALKELADYYESVRTSVESAVDSTTKGFEYIGDAAQRQTKRLESLYNERNQLEEQKKDLTDIDLRISNAKDIYGIGNLTNNLQSQVNFLKEYKADMEKARALGFSDEFLAQFADGSVESAEWLHELANATDGQKDELNALYAEVTEGKKELTDTLTQQQLTVDEVYKSLAEKAKEAVAGLDLENEAAENTGKTVEGIAQGIKDHVNSVSEQVDAIIAELNRLDGFGINIDFGGFGSIDFTTSTGKKADGSGRFGLDYIPRDDYLIRAHEGERLLTAQENQIWNALLNGGVAGFDLDSLGGVMRDNIKPGGNVYLDGKAVGAVISERQGRSYRTLQRSGWQT